MSRIKTIYATAPTRICDLGGWTDTWFAEYGSVLNMATTPRSRVFIRAYPRGSKLYRVMMEVKNYRDHYALDLTSSEWQKHPLLEATIKHIGIPEAYDVEISLLSDARSGASMGTSASVTVALISALKKLSNLSIDPHQIAYDAHHVETVILGRQSGIQDQLASAYGGINYIEMPKYPQTTVQKIQLSEDLRRELSQRLMVIYLGSSHDSSQGHKTVITKLENLGADAPQLNPLREIAKQGRDTLVSGDFDAFGKIMSYNTELQRQLHPELISKDADQVIEIAESCGALGWKINGAGGNGGTITLLCDRSQEAQFRMKDLILRVFPTFKNFYPSLTEGIHISEIRAGISD